MLDESRHNILGNVARCLALELTVLEELKQKRRADPSGADILDPLIEQFEKNCAFFEKWKSKIQAQP